MNSDDPIVIDVEDNGSISNPSKDDRLLSMLIYVTSIFTTIIGPLIIWLIKRDESEFINYHGKEYFNFVISFFVYSLVAGLSTIILIGFILVPIVTIAFIVLLIMAAVKSYNGEYYRIPFVFRLIK